MGGPIYSFFNLFNLGARLGVDDHRHAQAALSLRKRQEAGLIPMPVWTGGEEDNTFHRYSIPGLSNT